MKRQGPKPSVVEVAAPVPVVGSVTQLRAIQGLVGNTLVAGKTTALRMYAEAATIGSAARVDATVLRPDGSRRFFSWESGSFHTISDSVLVVTIPGLALPWHGTYYFRVRVSDGQGELLLDLSLDDVQLLVTKDLRVMVSRLWSGTPAKPGELAAAQTAMERMSWLFPLRDGVSSLDGSPNAGLRYNLDDAPMGPPKQDGHLCPLFAQWSNRPAPGDSIDVAISYRFPNAGEGSGGNSSHKCPGQQVLFSVIVWGAPLANVFCQETAHAFGLEAPGSPHLDPSFNQHHSKDAQITPDDTVPGFNTQYGQGWPVPTWDIMYPTGPDPEYPDPAHSLNAWDWEYLRNQLVKLPSSGPTAPFISWASLLGQGLRSYPTVGHNADGRQEIFVVGGDHVLYHIWETTPGGPWSPWSGLGGHDLQDICVVSNEADGSLAVFVLGGDGIIYHRRQAVPGGGWAAWTAVGGNSVKNFAVASNADGRLELLAVFGDGTLHDISQTGADGGWVGWKDLGGVALEGNVAVARNVDGRLQAFAIGGDGVVYDIWQLGSNGVGGWSPWSGLADPDLPRIVDVTTISVATGELYVFLMRSDGAVSYRAQTTPGGAWADTVHLAGHDLQWPCAVGMNPDGRLEIFVVGGNHRFYNRWQIDSRQPNGWSEWIILGGPELHAGVAVAPDQTGELVPYVVGSDGQLYRGPR